MKTCYLQYKYIWENNCALESLLSSLILNTVSADKNNVWKEYAMLCTSSEK